MAAFLAKIISKKILGERLENAFGKEVSLTFRWLLEWGEDRQLKAIAYLVVIVAVIVSFLGEMGYFHS